MIDHREINSKSSTMQLPILEACEKFDEFNLHLVQLKEFFYVIASHECVHLTQSKNNVFYFKFTSGLHELQWCVFLGYLVDKILLHINYICNSFYLFMNYVLYLEFRNLIPTITLFNQSRAVNANIFSQFCLWQITVSFTYNFIWEGLILVKGQ